MNSPVFDFTTVVDDHYGDVYRFALSLARDDSEAADLTQEAFWRLAKVLSQIRDPRKAKSWLFTTLHREFLSRRRRADRFPHDELTEAETRLPVVDSDVVEALDARTALDALGRVEEVFRAPLSLFYLEDFSYAEIAEVLDIPLGTVMSRLFRGKAQLKQLLAEPMNGLNEAPIIRFPRKAA